MVDVSDDGRSPTESAILRQCRRTFEVEESTSGWTPVLDCTGAFIRALKGGGAQTFLAGKNTYEANLRPDGTLVQVNCDTGFVRECRVQPGFAVSTDFAPHHPAGGSFVSSPEKLRPIQDPVVIDALVTVYRGGASTQQYATRSNTYEVRRSVDGEGNVRLMQRNTTTETEREIYLLPSFFSISIGGWVPIVDASSALAYTKTTRCQCRYSVDGVAYETSMDDHGKLFITNTSAGTSQAARQAGDDADGAATGAAPRSYFEFELKTGKWLRITESAAEEAIRHALVGGRPQRFKSSANKDKKEWEYEVAADATGSLTQKNVQTGKVRAVRCITPPRAGPSLFDLFCAIAVRQGEEHVDLPRLLPLRQADKPPAPTCTSDAVLHVAHAAIFDASCIVYGGFLRDWVVRGEMANDVDVTTSDYDATQHAMTTALSAYGIALSGAQPWGQNHDYRRLQYSWQGHTIDVDLVDPSKVPPTPPGVDCDVGNLQLDKHSGLQLKVPRLGQYVSLAKSVKHCMSKKFVLFYDPSAGDVAGRRLKKYVGRGWVCKSHVPPTVASQLGLSAEKLKPKQKYSKKYWQL
jgi:hypothetical protein